MTTQKPVGAAEYREGRAAMFADILEQLATMVPELDSEGNPLLTRAQMKALARQLRGGRE